MRNNRTFWIVLLVALLAFCFCCALAAGFLVIGSWRLGDNLSFWTGRAEVTERLTRTLDVQTPVVLSVDLSVGDITVRTGESQQVVVEATKHAWDWNRSAAQRILGRINVSIEQSGNQVQIKATGLVGANTGPRSPMVDLVVTVPAQTQVEINGRVGRISVAGTEGDLTIIADVGEVILTDVKPAERLSVASRVASIELSGALIPGAVYELVSDVGRIAVQAPEESNFSIDARSDIGDVSVGFPVSGRSEREGFVGKQVRGDVGADPMAKLSLRSRIGNITVQPLR